MRHSDGLTCAPVGTKYVVEAHGSYVRRYVEFPNGRTVALAKRKAVSRPLDGKLTTGSQRNSLNKNFLSRNGFRRFSTE